MSLYGASSAAVPLCETFTDLATATWHEIGRDLISGVPLGEESLTSILLRELELRHPKQIRIVPHPKRKEGQESGADWEWWLIEPNDAFGMAVQAKKINAEEAQFTSLHKNSAEGRPQWRGADLNH
jgi:hypothetical protein